MTGGEPNERPIPATQHAIQIVDAGRVVHNREKAVPRPGPHQVLVRMEACGICFSDTKLLHAFASHPRKSVVFSGLDADVLAEIPSYVPGRLPTVPGHEPVGRIVAVGDQGPPPSRRRTLPDPDRLPAPSQRSPRTRRSATTSKAGSRSTSCSTSG